MIPVIAIDGPSGSGKGTVSRLVAKKLGFHYLDSGAIYRGLALVVEAVGLDCDASEAELCEVARDLDLRFSLGAEPADDQILVAGQEASDRLRTETCGNMASKLAAIPSLREALLQRQRDYRQYPGLVADGRDMGTTVFIDSRLKIFLSASAEERAERRYKQLKEKGLDANLAQLCEEIRERDERDSSRPVSPLVPADDAIVIDTTGMPIDRVVETVMQSWNKQ